MRNPQGYGVVFAPGGVMSETDTFTCGHCNSIVNVPVKARPEEVGGLCKQCNHLICPACVLKLSCTPWELQMERIESRDRFLRSAGLT